MKLRKWSARKHLAVLSIAAVLSLTSSVWAAKDKDDDQPEVVKRMNNASEVLSEVMGTPEKAIPNKVLSDARCMVIIPSMFKIALGFGGSHGKGIATCRTDRGWSAPAPVSISGGSWGLQLGGQSVDLVMLVMNQKGLDALLADKFKVGADASAAAGPVGRDTGADTDWKMKAEVLSYSRARGVFAGIDLNGSVLSQDKDDTRLLYGKMEPFKDILYGDVPSPTSAHEFLATVSKYAPNTPTKQGSTGSPGSEASNKSAPK
jgi:SH3 domain-containing YSC84-like protein 1